uniref:JmjC domain-containing protein n=1 Tax=Leptocylindrus danicus TaxID=163516 RepID=A0A7S2PHT5_9STRA|mmetsp:Transcript_32842/g.47539  ORF Transcript_32842/g.47539 Transcript_32842/m.47539 type:complete len:460 (+) Transcript_32842:141-1520(+)|eukprot:CAMPEP_0116013652 /NCGR_PEP_ID=MMETSP0321-20121206/5846_1 /TAXON_ID=163516 /ORGANISM="Leptocylindrus danicus var. danicus, Strain B650" /LENGTH=459 /DNA_ID=CAMNT_0003483227 /DNA_START=141 /DNA_END=1520 /DNA_ORIENTATION=+
MVNDETTGTSSNSISNKRFKISPTPTPTPLPCPQDNPNHNHAAKENQADERHKSNIPTLAPKSCTYEEFRKVYDRYQVVLFPAGDRSCNDGNRTNTTTCNSNNPVRRADNNVNMIHDIFQSITSEDDRSSWCIENDKSAGTASCSNSDFLRADCPDDGYCSFLVQKDVQVKERLLKGNNKDSSGSLPMVDLPLKWEISDNVDDGSTDGDEQRDIHTSQILHYGPCIWIFFGRNNSKKSMPGRPLHTDSISHDGTWHYQLSGSKTWHLRPTQELLDAWRTFDGAEGDICDVQLPGKDDEWTITCKEGDVILCNTRLWWHRTEISQTCTSDDACAQNLYAPSISYARDVYLDGPPNAHNENDDDNGGSNAVVGEGGMTNVDGLYAANDIEENTIVFTEEDMPDCELHRSSDDPNCKVVELENGSGAIVSIRDIRSGEFFSIAESSDEEEEGSDDCEEEEED